MHRAALLLLALLMTTPATLGAGQALPLLDRVPAGRDLYVSVDFATLAKSPHLPDLLRFLKTGLKVGVFGLEPASGIDFGTTARAGVVTVKGSKTPLTVLSGTFDAEKTRGHLKGLANKAATDAKAATEAAKAREADAAKAAGRALQVVKDVTPEFTFEEKALSGLPALKIPGGSWVVFIAPDLVAAGTEKALAKALPTLQGKGSPASKDATVAKYARQADSARPIWWVSVNPAASREAFAKKGDRTLADVEASVGGVTLADELVFDGVVLTARPESATDLAARIQKRLADVKGKFLVKTLGVASYLDGVVVAPESSRVSVKHKLARNQVQVLLKVGGQLIGLAK